MNNIKQLPKLMVFTLVAQKGSFTSAAEHLGLSKSAVSQQVKQLESELGVQLLNRTTREISLTAIGQTLLERCTLLQDQVNLLFNDIASAGHSPSGQFTITYPHALQTSIIMPAIEQLCTEYPKLTPRLIVDDQSLDLVEHQIDLALHVGELADSNYRALKLGEINEVFCASPTYLQKHGEIESVEQLMQQRWIATAWQQNKMSLENLKEQKISQVELQIYAKTNTLPSAIEMSLSHLGIVLIPDIVAKPLIRQGKLVHIAQNLQGKKSPVYALHAYQNEKPIHISRFYQLTKQRLANI